MTVTCVELPSQPIGRARLAPASLSFVAPFEVPGRAPEKVLHVRLVGVLEIVGQTPGALGAQRHHAPTFPEDANSSALVYLVGERLASHAVVYTPTAAENIVQVNHAA